MPATKSDTQLLNETLFEQLATPGLEKQAVDAINDFTRERVREDGFWRKLIPMLPIQNSDLDRQYDTDLPVKIVDMEPDSPAALSLPFATLPTNYYIRGRRYRVQFDRILTPRFTKDVDELRTWVMDIRQVMSDNALKDMLAEEDAKFLLAVNTGLISQGAIVPCSGTAQWQRLNGGITRDTIQDAYEEALDLGVYLKTLEFEREEVLAIFERAYSNIVTELAGVSGALSGPLAEDLDAVLAWLRGTPRT